MKDELIKLGKQKSTWVGIALFIGAIFGLPAGSGEQIAGLLAGVVGIIYPEKAEK